MIKLGDGEANMIYLGDTQVGGGNVVSWNRISEKLCGWLDATDINSYSGTGQSLLSLVTLPADGTTQAENSATLGTTSSSEASDPTFVGFPNDPDSYFSLDGGDWWHINTLGGAGTTSVLETMNTKSSGGAFFFWCGTIPEGTGTTYALMGNNSSGTVHGIALYLQDTGVLRVTNRGASTVITDVPSIPRGVPIMIVVSLKGTSNTDNLKVWVNEVKANTYSASYTNTTSGSNTLGYYVGSTLSGNSPLPSGTKLKAFGWGVGFLTDAEAEALFIGVSRKHNYDYIKGLENFNGGLRMAAIGDSITARNLWPKSHNTAYEDFDSAGQYVSANKFLNNVFVFGSPYKTISGKDNNCFGYSGQTAVFIETQKVTATRKDFDIIFVMAGTNDLTANVNNETERLAQLETIKTALSSMYDEFAVERGKYVVPITTIPRNDWGAKTPTQTTLAKQNLEALRAWIMTQHGSRNGRVFCIDSHEVLDDGTGNVAPITATTLDGVHLSPYGAHLLGRYIAQKLEPIFGRGSIPNFGGSDNLLLNGSLSGTAGTEAGGATGDTADSFTATLSGGTGGSPALTMSKNADGSQRMVLSANSSATDQVTGTFTQAITTGITTGDVVYGEILVQFSGTPTWLSEASFELNLTGTGAADVQNVKGNTQYIQAKDNTATSIGNPERTAECLGAFGQYIIRTPELYISTTASHNLVAKYTVKGTIGQTVSATVDIKGVRIVKRYSA